MSEPLLDRLDRLEQRLGTLCLLTLLAQATWPTEDEIRKAVDLVNQVREAQETRHAG